MCKYYFRFIYNKNIIYRLIEKATNYLLGCLFLYVVKSKIVLKIRSPTVIDLYLEIKINK